MTSNRQDDHSSPKEHEGTDETVPFSSVQPSAHLPRLSHLSSLPMEQRKQAIAAWVSWSNANPHLLDAERQRKLDQALRALEEPAQQEANEKEWGAQFDQWLDGILKEENPT